MRRRSWASSIRKSPAASVTISATLGRRRAHATYYQSHAVDLAQGMNFAVDLTALIENEKLDPAEYIGGFIQRFAEDVNDRVKKFA